MSFHYGVDKHQTEGPEQLQNYNFKQGLNYWKLEQGEISLLDLNFNQNGTHSIYNKQKTDIDLQQIIQAPKPKLIKVNARLEAKNSATGEIIDPPFEVQFSYRRLHGKWRSYSIAKLDQAVYLRTFQKLFWIDKSIADIKLSFKIPANKAHLIIHSFSVQTVENKKLFGLSYHRLDLLLIAICCVLLIWVLFSSYCIFPMSINIVSSLSIVLFIYLLKSSMGYDFFQGFSFGIWDWISSLI